jgi:hypothetical protein
MISERSVWFQHVKMGFFTRTSAITTHNSVVCTEGFLQSVISTHTNGILNAVVILTHKNVISTRRVWFLIVVCDFSSKKCDFRTYESDCYTHKCDYDTQRAIFFTFHHAIEWFIYAECDFHTQSVILTRMSVALTRTSVILTACDFKN